MLAYTKSTLERLFVSFLALISWSNLAFAKPRRTFTPFFNSFFLTVKHSTVAKCCKAYQHRAISSANTMCTINADVWGINTCLTKQRAT